MDETRMIRSLLGEAPPSAEVVAEGRRRLSAGGPSRSPARTRRRLWGGLTALGAAAIALALVAGLTGGSPRPGTPEPVLPLTARQVLLTAAERAAAQPVGKYWHTHVISSEGYHIARGDYMIFGARHEIDQWRARSDSDADVFRSRFGAATPQTAADHAAWEKAGAPTSWRVLSNGAYIAQSARSGPWDLRRSSPAEKRKRKQSAAEQVKRCARIPGGCVPKPLSPEQPESLRRDPHGLKRYLLDAAGPGDGSNLLSAAATFLLDPSSPELRAAVFRVLADSPGVRDLGTTRDPLGRPAIVLAERTKSDRNVEDNELLLDPSTYTPLGTQVVLVKGNGGKPAPLPPGVPRIPGYGQETKGMKPGAITHSEIYVVMGWTNTAYGG
ncbi:MAG TPA: CU044_5270 family protein [Actinoallomurus sp.]|jgi:hypothetical protein|nr:CU044_5270 family protein [Actinoallomurus sp.]